MIKFDEAAHTYTNTETEEKYISVTTLLGLYKTPFDKDKHSKRVAEREGVSQEMVLEMWDKENKKATTRGTKIHKLMEDYVCFGEKAKDYDWVYKSYDSVVERSIDKHKKVYSENLLHDHTYKVAGTADLIYDHGDYFTIADFKTNKRFNFSSDFNEWFKDPITHLQYCEFNNYALQMSMYAYMYEKISGKKCKKVVVFYLREDKWQPYHCNYLKSDIVQILNHYAINKINEKRDSA
jgi:ATP-dependent exoDNAse (exonuclease V) beta subunit